MAVKVKVDGVVLIRREDNVRVQRSCKEDLKDRIWRRVLSFGNRIFAWNWGGSQIGVMTPPIAGPIGTGRYD